MPQNIPSTCSDGTKETKRRRFKIQSEDEFQPDDDDDFIDIGDYVGKNRKTRAKRRKKANITGEGCSSADASTGVSVRASASENIAQGRRSSSRATTHRRVTLEESPEQSADESNEPGHGSEHEGENDAGNASTVQVWEMSDSEDGDDETGDEVDADRPVDAQTERMAEMLLEKVRATEACRRQIEDDVNAIANWCTKYTEQADSTAASRIELIGTITNSIRKKFLDCQEDEDADDYDEDERDEDEEMLSAMANSAPPISNTGRFKARCKALRKQFAAACEKMNKAPDAIMIANGLAHRSLETTMGNFDFWIRFVATTPNEFSAELQLKDFNETTCVTFWKFLTTLLLPAAKSIPFDKQGKPYEPATITGIIFSTFLCMKLLGYVGRNVEFNSIVAPTVMAIVHRNANRSRGQEIVTHYPLYPQDILLAVGRMKFTSQKIHQDATYLLLKSVTMLRCSSLLANAKYKVPGIKLSDIQFFVDSSQGQTPRLSVRITVRYEKQIKKSGSSRYKGKGVVIRGSDETTCPVKFLYVQCVYLEAFEDKFEHMWETNNFVMRDEMKETNLFRSYDQLGIFTDTALTGDTPIFDRLAPLLGLPRRKIGGHSLRHGSAALISEDNVQAQGGFNSTSTAGIFKMTGRWHGGGYKNYIKPTVEKGLNLTALLLEGKADPERFLESAYMDRHVVYALGKQEYVSQRDPIVVAACDMAEEIKKGKAETESLKMKWENEKKDRVDGKDAAVRAAYRDYSMASNRYNLNRRSHAIHLASCANQFRVEEKLVKQERQECEVHKLLLDAKKFATTAEKYIATGAKFYFGPFREPPSTDVQLQCYYEGCNEKYGEIWKFKDHLKSHTETEAHQLRCPSKWHPGKSAKGTDRVYNYASMCGLKNHFLYGHHVARQCRDCGQQYTGRSGNKHKRRNAEHRVVHLQFFLNYDKCLIIKCPRCESVRNKLGLNPCIAESNVVTEVLKTTPESTDCFKAVRNRAGWSSQELHLSQTDTALSFIYNKLFPTAAGSDYIETLERECPCVIQKVREWRNRKMT